jgi:hypothetical protein
MKRNIIPVLAVILAISLSAFTTKNTVKANKLQPALYWYTISGTQLSGPVNSVPRDKTTEMAFTPCDDTQLEECLLGTDSDADAGQSITIVNSGFDYHIKKN